MSQGTESLKELIAEWRALERLAAEAEARHAAMMTLYFDGKGSMPPPEAADAAKEMRQAANRRLAEVMSAMDSAILRATKITEGKPR